MKVFILAGSLNQGGAEYQTLAIAKMFRDYGHEVTILALTDHKFYLDYVIQNDLSYQALSNSMPKVIRVFQTWWAVQRFKPDFMISYTRVVSKVAIKIKQFSYFNFTLLVSERTSKISLSEDTNYFTLVEKADIFTTNAISKYKHIKENYPSLAPKLHFFPNLMDLNGISKKSAATFSDKHMRFIFAGRISPEKNVLRMIEAFALVDTSVQWTLDIFGAHKNVSYVKEVSECINNNELNARVFLKGVSRDMAKLYAQYDCLCLFSEFEGFSNVISEAMVAGIPIICSDIEENKYLVDDDINGLWVDNSSSILIAEKLNKALQWSVDKKIEISRSNQSKAISIFDSEKLYNTYISLLGDRK